MHLIYRKAAKLLLLLVHLISLHSFLLPLQRPSSITSTSISESRPRTLWNRLICLSSTQGVCASAATEMFESLVKELLTAKDLPTLALEKADAFDYNFMSQLMRELQAATGQEEIDALNKVGEAVNFAMQQRLAKADYILRGILKAGDLKVMEAKMRKHLKAGELDMAFDVILNVNAQQARADEGNESAANILQHLSTMLAEERDKKLSPETQLLRMLLRTKESNERIQMLLEKLLLKSTPPRPMVAGEDGKPDQEQEPFWGEPEVEPLALRNALIEWLSEVSGLEKELETDIIDRARMVGGELDAIVAKFG